MIDPHRDTVMQARSAHTQVFDPYRAGAALGEALADLAPEVVFLFSSVHYGEPPDLLDGLYDAIGNDALVVIGNSGDGCFASAGATDHGVSALAINSGGKMRWQLAVGRGVADEPEAALRTALQSLRAAQPDTRLIYLACDFNADASRIEAVLHGECDLPVVGGYAADDNRMQACYLYANRSILHDAIVLLGLAGDFEFDIHIANTLGEVGQPGTIEAAEGKVLQRIAGEGAVDFVARQTGKPVLQTDRGIVSLSIVDPAGTGERRLRAIVPDFGKAEKSLGLYGGIEVGKQVRVCLADPAQLIDEVTRIADTVAASDFKPAAAVIVSCAGRKWLLGGQIAHETRALTERMRGGLPLAGFPSFGEFGPLRTGQGYTGNLFHNMTYVLLLLA
jgi:hypothetical protein